MTQTDPKYNHRVNHRLLNYLFANSQGQFTSLNIKYQLGVSTFNRNELEQVRASLKQIRGWLDDLKKGILIFHDKDDQEALQKQAQVLQRLKNLKPVLGAQARKVASILADDNFFENRDAVIELVASFGFYVYAKDNYIRGHLEFSDLVDDQNVIETYNKQLEDITNETKLIHELLSTMKSPDRITEKFYEHLRFCSRVVPGNLMANIHDVNQFLTVNEKDFTFAMADFTVEEEQAWHIAGFGTIEAGYWRAYEFTIDEALFWSRLGIIEPYLAYDWKTAGFPPQEAIPWIHLMFTPLLAIQWMNARIAAPAAARLIAAGYHHPADIPAEQATEIFSRVFPEMLQRQVQQKQIEVSELDEDPDDDYNK